MKSTLVYSIACDEPGLWIFKNLQQLLVNSLIQTGYEGTIVAFHDAAQRLYPDIPVKEVSLPPRSSPERTAIWAQKYAVLPTLLDLKWDRLLFLDADTLVQRPLRGVFDYPDGVAVCPEINSSVTDAPFNGYLTEEEMVSLRDPGINSGVFSVERSLIRRLYGEWRRVDESPLVRPCWCRDQASLNRVLVNRRFPVHHYRPGEVAAPLHTDPRWLSYRKATILHFVGGQPDEKLDFSHMVFAANHSLHTSEHYKAKLVFEYA